jgi:tetratricopeptide (TPR) repeat protein
MPVRKWMTVHFHTDDDKFVPPIRRHEHRIAIYPEAQQELLLEWHRAQQGDDHRQEVDRLTKDLVQHWLAEAERYRRDYRFLVAIGAAREALRFDSSPALHEKLRELIAIQSSYNAELAKGVLLLSERQVPEAIQTLKQCLQIKPDSAPAHGRLGTCLAMVGQKRQAIEHWRAVAKCDPDDSYGESMIGWLALLDGKNAQAVESYRRADEIEPNNAKINLQLGLSLAQLGQLPEAIERFRRVLALDPKHAETWQVLSVALRKQGGTAEALRCAQRAAVLTKFENPDVLVTLADGYAAVDRLRDAVAAVEAALEVAPARTLNQQGEILGRIKEFRSRAGLPPK